MIIDCGACKVRSDCDGCLIKALDLADDQGLGPAEVDIIEMMTRGGLEVSVIGWLTEPQQSTGTETGRPQRHVA